MTLHEASFAIRTEAFEGPLELLLELIEKRKLLINDISLASVTDEYMAHVDTMQEHSIPETAQFVLVASTLLLIKSKSLLPVLDLTEDEEESIDDLEKRLRLYQIYRDAGKQLRNIFGTAMLNGRTFQQRSEPVFKPDAYTKTDVLCNVMEEVLKNLPRKQEKRKVTVRQVVSLEETIERLQKRVTDQLKLTFKEFSGNEQEKGNLIVSFLAVLELVKQGMVMVRQQSRCADIEIERDTVDTPQYS